MQNAIKDMRKSHNLTQKQLAERVNVKRETIANLESGKYNPSLDLADRIAAALGCHLYELFPSLLSAEHHSAEIEERQESTRTATLEGIAHLAKSYAYDTHSGERTCDECGEPATQAFDGRPLCDECYWDSVYNTAFPNAERDTAPPFRV